MKKIITLILSLTLLTALGCSKKSSQHFSSSSDSSSYSGMLMPARAELSSDDMVYRKTYNQYEDERDGGGNASNAPTAYSTERKLVKSAHITIRVESLESTDDSVSDLMKRYNAYAASTNIEENSRHYSLRVPAQNYDTFLGEMGSMGRIIRRNENTEDVTLRYYDLESRLATKKELLVTYQSYLGKAKNIEEILSVEARIADLQSEIDRTGTQFRNLANTVDYATIELSLVGPVTITPYQTTTFGERIKRLFSGFGSFLSIVGVIITGVVIYGIPALLILAFLVWVLFGRVGLLKKLWRLITAQEPITEKKEGE